jgi:hypothetical protein
VTQSRKVLRDGDFEPVAGVIPPECDPHDTYSNKRAITATPV